MNDPHVVALHYDIKHADSTDYKNAPPLDHEEADFSVHVEKDKARIAMKGHYGRSDSARGVVEPFLRAWEMAAALVDSSDNFEFVFQNAEIVDRMPSPGPIHAVAIQEVAAFSNMDVRAHVARGRYPGPPAGLAMNGEVEMMLCCYRMYCDRRRTISDACYFCLTVMERAAGDRAKAAVKYNINKKVLDKIGELTANKGGKEARKIRGALDEYTMAERTWLENVMKMLIRRAAEAAYDSYESNAKQRRIGLNDLPPL